MDGDGSTFLGEVDRRLSTDSGTRAYNDDVNHLFVGVCLPVMITTLPWKRCMLVHVGLTLKMVKESAKREQRLS